MLGRDSYGDGLGARSLVALQVLVVVALGLASWYLLPLASLPIIAAIAGAGFVLVLLRQPALGPSAVIVASVAVPFSLGTGTGTSLGAGVLALGLLLALWPAQAVARGSPLAPLAAPMPPLILLVLVALLAFVAGNQPWIPFAATAPLRAQLGGLAIFGLSAGAFALTAYRTPSIRWLQVTVWTFIALGGLYEIARFGGFATLLRGVVGVEGSLFWLWLGALAFGQAVWNRDLHWFLRSLVLGVSLFAFLGPFLFIRDWLSGWFPALAAIGATLLIGSPRLAVPLGLVGAALGAAAAPFVMASVTGGDNEYSLMTRLEALRVVWPIFQISPVIGLGPANYYWYTPLFPILGYYVNFVSHNNYVDLLLQTGLLGMACFVWFVAALFLTGWRLRASAKDRFSRAYVYGALGGLAGTQVAMMLGDWALPMVYNIGFAGMRASLLGWLFLGGLVAIERLSRPAPPRATDRSHPVVARATAQEAVLARGELRARWSEGSHSGQVRSNPVAGRDRPRSAPEVEA